MECIKCHSDEIIKYWHGRKWSQRMLCNTCHSTFTSLGIRGTYAQSFIEKIVHQYKHQHETAKKIINTYSISSRTLIKRSKKINWNCPFCK